jgi:hypothetical protein
MFNDAIFFQMIGLVRSGRLWSVNFIQDPIILFLEYHYRIVVLGGLSVLSLGFLLFALLALFTGFLRTALASFL